jgi:uncharacterized protein
MLIHTGNSKRFLLFTIAILFAYITSSFAQDFPEKASPPKLVNDFAGLLDASQEQQLEQKLVAYDDSTSTQISIVTITDLGNYDVSSYSFELAEKWGIGQKGKNNGLLILISKNQRKTFIATGYGLESKLTDALCKRIITNVINPRFKEGNFYQGLDDGTNAVFQVLAGEFKAETKTRNGSQYGIIILVFIIIIALIILSNRNNRGGGNGGYRRTFGSTGFFPMNFGGGGGFSGFGGGGSSGGFGGFGGGSFGGGGAGGDW